MSPSQQASQALTGLLKGDYLTGMYNNCNLGGSVLLNGRVKLTAISTMANLVAGDFATSYEADMTDFSLDGVIYSGVINATTNISNGSTNFSEAFAVTSPLGLSVNSGRITNTFGQGASFAQVDGANGAASRKLDGNVKVVANADSIPLVISTSTPLLGSTNSRRFIANSGVIAVKQNAESLATETSFSGAVASVKADSNKDGSLDFVFISTWSELITFAP